MTCWVTMCFMPYMFPMAARFLYMYPKEAVINHYALAAFFIFNGTYCHLNNISYLPFFRMYWYIHIWISWHMALDSCYTQGFQCFYLTSIPTLHASCIYILSKPHRLNGTYLQLPFFKVITLMWLRYLYELPLKIHSIKTFFLSQQDSFRDVQSQV